MSEEEDGPSSLTGESDKTIGSPLLCPGPGVPGFTNVNNTADNNKVDSMAPFV